MTTEELDRKISSQVLWQAMQRHGQEGRRGVEEVHSTILERRQDADAQRMEEPAKVFEDRGPGRQLRNSDGGEEGEDSNQIVTVDFLRKYLRFCKRLTPVLSQKAQALVADKYVDMRMRFQSGFSDLSNPEGKQKPRLAVTTRTLEALIRLATAHAKLKLRKDAVLEEDVEQAYELMLAAREEEIPTAPAPAEASVADRDGSGGAGTEASQRRGRKRPAEDSAETVDDGEPTGVIQAARLTTLQTVMARAFVEFGRQGQFEIPRGDLLESVNSRLAQGEPPFLADEFDAGLTRLEDLNKVMLHGDVVVPVS